MKPLNFQVQTLSIWVNWTQEMEALARVFLELDGPIGLGNLYRKIYWAIASQILGRYYRDTN